MCLVTLALFKIKLKVKSHLPLLRQVVWRVVGFQMNPLTCRQIESVEICAVDVACRTSKYIEEAIDYGHRLQNKSGITIQQCKLVLFSFIGYIIWIFF